MSFSAGHAAQHAWIVLGVALQIGRDGSSNILCTVREHSQGRRGVRSLHGHQHYLCT